MVFHATRFIVIFCFASSVLLSCANIERVGHSKSKEASQRGETDSLPYRSESNRQNENIFDEASSNINPAVKALMAQAQQQKSEGKIDSATSTIERALRISPQTPQLHLFLGELRLKQNQAYNALQLAFKGQSLISSNDIGLAKSFWQLIGDCYTSLGKTTKAKQAYSHL